MEKIQFLRPQLPQADSYLPLLQQMDKNGQYSNFGPLNQRFEQRLLAGVFNQNGFLTTVSNATLGLMLAIAAVKRRGARYAVMPSFTFAATPLAAQWCGLEPFFIDIDPVDWSIDTDKLETVIERLGDDLAVIVPYATFGQALDIKPYNRWLQRGIPVVIDAAPCLGQHDKTGHAFCEGFPGAIVYSCHATKPFGIGEGGIIYSADRSLIERIRQASNFGFDDQRCCELLGLNAKLPESAAAVGLLALDSFTAKVLRLGQLYSAYQNLFEEFELEQAGWQLQYSRGQVPHPFFPVLVPDRSEADNVMQQLENHGIQTRAYFRPPCHRQKYFRNCLNGGLPVTDTVARRIVCLPLWDGMDHNMVEQVVTAVATVALEQKPAQARQG